MTSLTLALILYFTPPVQEQVEVHITRQIDEVGRQEVNATTYTPSGLVAPCTCLYGSPRGEIHAFTATEDGEYRLEVSSQYDPASISIQIFIVPRLMIAGDNLQYYAYPGQSYTVERTYLLGSGERWKHADKRRKGEFWQTPGWKLFPIDFGRKQINYRVRVGR